MAKKSKNLTYAEAGVNIDEGNRAVKMIQHHLQRTYGPNVLANPGGFAGLYSLGNSGGLFAKKYKEPVLLACSDGVGTKLKIAFLMDKHDTVGIDLVAMSVNDLVVQGAEPLFFLDYIAASKLEPQKVADIVKGIADGCRESGCALLGGETAELPGFYQPGDYDLAGFAVGIADRKKLINGNDIIPGDVVIGVASSGLHSNGYSLANKALLDHGGLSLDKHVPELGCTLGEELLRPTRIYAKAVNQLQKYYNVKKIVKGIAHITGGGLVENIPRILPQRTAIRIEKNKWTVPPIFELISSVGNVEEAEMFRVFNMGIGLVLVCPEFNANRVCQLLRDAEYDAHVIGRVMRGKRSVSIM